MMQQQSGSAADGIEAFPVKSGGVCAATQSRLALGRVWALFDTAAVGTALCGSK